MPEKTLRDCGVQQYGYPIFKLLVEVYPQKFFPCAGEQCLPLFCGWAAPVILSVRG